MVKLVTKQNFLFSTSMSIVPKEQTQWKFLSLTAFPPLLTSDPYLWGQAPIPFHFFSVLASHLLYTDNLIISIFRIITHCSFFFGNT